MRRTTHPHYLCILLSLLLLLVFPSAVYGDEYSGEDGEAVLAPYFVIEGADPGTDSFPLK